jgi:hypothetical protein
MASSNIHRGRGKCRDGATACCLKAKGSEGKARRKRRDAEEDAGEEKEVGHCDPEAVIEAARRLSVRGKVAGDGDKIEMMCKQWDEADGKGCHTQKLKQQMVLDR